jgi:uncharacterized membrane protein
MNSYMLMVFVHVAAAVMLLGGSVLGSPHVRASVRRATHTRELRAYLAMGQPLLVLEPVAALLVLASGVFLASVANFWTLAWVQVATVFWLVNAVVAGALVKPAIGRLAAAAAEAGDGPVGEHLEVLRRSSRWSFGGDLLMANDTAMLFLMVFKPGLTGSLLAVATANGVTLAFRIAARAFRSPAMLTPGRSVSAEHAQPRASRVWLAPAPIASDPGFRRELVEGIAKGDGGSDE